MTLKDLYLQEKNKPSPARIFIDEIAALTHRSPNTIRMWIFGHQTPDDLAKSILSEKFGVDPEILFPPEQQKC